MSDGMGQVKQAVNQEKQKPVSLTPATKERLKIIANIIVERIIEDHQNRVLRFKRQPGKKYGKFI